jgi:hypothetical protein
MAKCSPSDEPLDQPGDADLVDHLGKLAGAGRAHQIAGARIGGDHLLGAGERRSSPPHITVSTPFSAPAWPPDTGASMNSKPRFFGGGVELARDLG